VKLSDADVVGVVILLGMLTQTSEGIAWGDGWHWPIPDLITKDGQRYIARISQEMKPNHRGVDMMYRRNGASDRPEFPAGVPEPDGAKANAQWFAPLVPILAARAGKVWSVRRIPQGWWVVIDHGRPWATSYHHLKSVGVAAGDQVKAGQAIGIMGHNPNTNPANGTVDHERLRHLHFEPWYKGGDSHASRDPASVINSWGRSSWTL